MGSTVEAEYAAFEEKVKRTIFIDNVSPMITDTIMKKALGQFRVVKSVRFLQPYTEPANIQSCALVEMKSQEDAVVVATQLNQFPFMIGGMPRPVRALPAEPEMLDDRPIKPARKIHCRWLAPDDPDVETVKKMKLLAAKQAAETLFFLKQQQEREEQLSKQQGDVLKTNYKKYEMIDGVFTDRTASRLAVEYKLKVPKM